MPVIISKAMPQDLTIILNEVLKLPPIPLNDTNSKKVKTENTLTILQQETAIFSNSSSFEFVATRQLESCVLIISTLPNGKTLVTHYDGNEGYDLNRYLSDYRDCEISLKLIGGLGDKGLENLKKSLLALQKLSQKNNITFKITHQRLQESFHLEASSEIHHLNNYLLRKIADALSCYANKGLPEDCSEFAFPAHFHELKLDVYEKLRNATKHLSQCPKYADIVVAVESVLTGQAQVGLLMPFLYVQPKKISGIDTENPFDIFAKSFIQNPNMLDQIKQLLFLDPTAYQVARIFYQYSSGEKKSYYSDVALSLKTGEFCVLPHHQCSIGPDRLKRLLRTIALPLENHFTCYNLGDGGIPGNSQISKTVRQMLFRFIPHLREYYISKATSDAIYKDFKTRAMGQFTFVLAVLAEISRNEDYKEFRQQPNADVQASTSSSSSSSTGLKGGFFRTTAQPSSQPVTPSKPKDVEQPAVSVSSASPTVELPAAPATSQTGNNKAAESKFGGFKSGFLK
jgi:hypothetical protein